MHGKSNEDDTIIKATHLLDPGVESKFEELRYEILHKIDKELTDSQNTREFISQKYDELCNKIQYLTELDATVNGFRSDVKAIEKQILDLSMRLDGIEKKALFKECSSMTSSAFWINKLMVDLIVFLLKWKLYVCFANNRRVE